MSVTRTLAHWFLVLVLLAGGAFAPATATGANTGNTAAEADVDMPCHGMDSDPPDAQPETGCCDDGACACDCLQKSATTLVEIAPSRAGKLTAVLAARPPQRLPATTAAPEIRPPIV